MITKQSAGLHNGYKLWVLTLTNSLGTEVRLTNYSGAIMSIKTADKNNNLADVVLGYDDIEGYINGGSSQGALIGRYANRIGGAAFTLNGEKYLLTANDGKNSLHGGGVGYNKRVWELLCAEYDKNSGENHVVFGYTSPDGEENYPGTVAITVDYCLNEKNELQLEYIAATSADTVLNLTNHVYFNLGGFDSGSVSDTQLQIFAEKYTPVGSDLIPTGEIAAVSGTKYDFTRLRKIDCEKNGGYDHNFILPKATGGELVKAAYALEPKSGRTLTTYTDMPAVQLYTANGLSDEIGKGGKEMKPYTAFCLETQFSPNTPNCPAFGSAVLKVDEKYHHTTVYKFGINE